MKTTILGLGLAILLLAACGPERHDRREAAPESPGGDGPVARIQLLQVAERNRCEILTQSLSAALASHAPDVQASGVTCHLVPTDSEHRYYALDVKALTKGAKAVGDVRLATYVSDYADSVRPLLCHVARDPQGAESGFQCFDQAWQEQVRALDDGLRASLERFRQAFEAVPSEAAAPAAYRPAVLAYAAKSGLIASDLGAGRVWFTTDAGSNAKVTMVGKWPLLSCDSLSCLGMLAMKLQWSDANKLQLVATPGGAVPLEAPSPRLVGLTVPTLD